MVRPRTICLLLALITVLAYLPVRKAAFLVFDDPDYIGNSHVKAGLTSAGVKWAFTTFYASNWHPLTWLSHMLDASLFGPDPGAQHCVNVLFHAANVVLLFLLLWRMTNKLWPAAFVAALFAWHPLHVESVAWISERKDVLSTFFGLLTLLAYGRYADESKVQSPKSKVWYAWTLVAFALSLMAKPMLVTLPFVMLLLDFWPLGRFGGVARNPQSADSRVTKHGTRSAESETRVPKLSTLILEKLPFLAFTAASCFVTFLAQRAEAVVSLEQRPFGLRFENALVSYVEYLGKTIWPMHLAVIYPLPNQIPLWQSGGAAAILAAISVFAWRTRKRAPYVLIGWLWFLGTLVPVIGLVQVGGQALADRYTYVPLIGVFIAAAYGAVDLAARFRISTAVISAAAALVLVASLCVTEYQLRFWQNSVALFNRALAVTKDNAIAHINLGVALEQEPGDHRAEATVQYRKAIGIEPRRFQAHGDLANLLSTMGSRDEAVREYGEALRLNPDDPSTHLNFGMLLADMGRFDDAMREYAEAARLAPDDPRPIYQMARASLRQGQSAEAVKHFRDALKMDPYDYQTLTWLARVLAADENDSVRNPVEAVSLAEQANELTGGQQPFIMDTLAIAYAAAGRFKDAQDTVQKAIDQANQSGAKKSVPEMQQRLQLYQASQPYREDFAKVLSAPE